MISKLSVRNFKSLRDVQIDLQPFTMFVGANGSGKSSILQALDFLCRSFHFQAGEEALRLEMSRGSVGPVELIVESGGNGYGFRAGSSSKAMPMRRQIGEPKWSGDGCGFTPDISSQAWEPWSPQGTDSTWPPQSRLFRLEASNLIQATSNPDVEGMTSDGRGLHSALASMVLNDPDTWLKLQADLQKIVPAIRRIRHTPPAANKPAALLFDTTRADALPATQVSEGTLLVLGLLAAFYAPDRPNVILLDDLDHGLHPKAQKDLISLLRGLLATNPDLQLLATTHSPYMLDCMDPAEVRMTWLEDGSTVCAPLASHPNFEQWKDEMYPGEMWSLFGEDWVAKQAVTAHGESA